MEIRVDCDFDVDTSTFAPKVLIFAFGGDVLEHTLPLWRLSAIDKEFGHFHYSHFVLTLTEDPGVSIVIGSNPLESKPRIIRYCNKEIGQFVTKIAKNLGGRPDISCLRSIRLGKSSIPIYKIMSRSTTPKRPE